MYLYSCLNQTDKETMKNINAYDNNFHFKEYEELFNKFTHCPNSITEEEYLIKNILE